MDGKQIMFETEGIAESDRVLYTPGDFAKQNLLYVQEAGVLTSLSAHKSAHKKLDSYLLLEVLNGSGTVAIGDNQYQLNIGDSVLIDCNRYYYHLSDDNDPWTIAWVHFNGYSAAGYYDMLATYCNDNPILSHVSVKQLVDEILPLMHVNHLKNELTVCETVQHTLNNILKRAIENSDRRSGVNWNKIREYVNDKCTTDEFELQNFLLGITQRFQIAKDEVIDGFTNHFGVDLGSYIEFRKLSIVKEKLRFTTKSISDIATESGMGDNDIFVEIFKKHENMTPAEYRRSWAQWIRG